MNVMTNDILRQVITASSHIGDREERRRVIRLDLSTRGFSKAEIIRHDEAIRAAIRGDLPLEDTPPSPDGVTAPADDGPEGGFSDIPLSPTSVPEDVLARISASVQGASAIRRRRQIRAVLGEEGYSPSVIDDADARIREAAGLDASFSETMEAAGSSEPRGVDGDTDPVPADAQNEAARTEIPAERSGTPRSEDPKANTASGQASRSGSFPDMLAEKPQFYDDGRSLSGPRERRPSRIGPFAIIAVPSVIAACAFAMIETGTSWQDIPDLFRTGEVSQEAQASQPREEAAPAAGKSIAQSPEMAKDGAEFEKIYDSLAALEIPTADCQAVVDIPHGGSERDFEIFDAGFRAWRSCLNSALADLDLERARIEVLLARISAIVDKHEEEAGEELASRLRLGIAGLKKRLGDDIGKARDIHVASREEWSETLEKRNAEVQRISGQNRARAEAERKRKRREEIERYNRNAIASGSVPESTSVMDITNWSRSTFPTPPAAFDGSVSSQPIHIPGASGGDDADGFSFSMRSVCPIGHSRDSAGECYSRAVTWAEERAYELEQQARRARDLADWERREAERLSTFSNTPKPVCEHDTPCARTQ